MSQQPQLWHDTLEDALRDVVVAAGGPKRVASVLWPAKDPQEGARHLNRMLDPERPEKPSLEELMFLVRLGAEHDCHTAIEWICAVGGYTRPERKNPETERDKIQREFIASVHAQQRLLKQLEALKL